MNFFIQQEIRYQKLGFMEVRSPLNSKLVTGIFSCDLVVKLNNDSGTPSNIGRSMCENKG